MFPRVTQSLKLFAATVCVLLSFSTLQAQASDAWLKRMSNAFATQNYDGVFVYVHGRSMDTLRIIHRVADGVERERIVRLDGPQQEIIRQNNKVTCVHGSDRVASVIADEPAVKVVKPRIGFFKPVLSMAVAASAAFLVIFAVQFGGQDGTGEQLAAGEQPLTTNLLAGSEPIAGSQGLVTVSSEALSPVEKRLQSLIESHTQQASTRRRS